jgi:hypothetical protein
MKKQQEHVVESFIRIRAFVRALPAPHDPAVAFATEALDRALAQLRDAAARQERGPTEIRASFARQQDLMGVLRDEHIRPLVTTARSMIAPTDDPGVREFLRMPKVNIRATTLLGVCDGMLAMLPPLAPVFIARGMPNDFLDRFRAARNALDASTDEREAAWLMRLTATRELGQCLRSCRAATDQLDAHIRATYSRNETILRSWRQVKRVGRRPASRSA